MFDYRDSAMECISRISLGVCMKTISMLIKPASSSCNMSCTYCFYHDVSHHRSITSYGIMSEEVMHSLIDFSFEEITEDGIIQYAFQGGEPTLAGIAYFISFINYVEFKRKKQTIHYAIQTNGLLLDEEWIALCKQYDILVGISLDGDQSIHDNLRKDQYKQETFHNVMQRIQLLKKANVRFNILCVLSEQLSQHPEKVYAFFKKEKIDYIQFIPCLPHLHAKHKEALQPNSFYRFYKAYFQLWYQDMQKGSAHSISLFDNIAMMLLDHAPMQCGMLGFCSNQFVVEADGSLYPCDFYVDDIHRYGNVQQDTIEYVRQSTTLYNFLHEKRNTYKVCATCHYVNLCHGGCNRMQSTFLTQEYCGYKALLEDIIPYMLSIIKK